MENLLSTGPTPSSLKVDQCGQSRKVFQTGNWHQSGQEVIEWQPESLISHRLPHSLSRPGTPLTLPANCSSSARPLASPAPLTWLVSWTNHWTFHICLGYNRGIKYLAYWRRLNILPCTVSSTKTNTTHSHSQSQQLQPQTLPLLTPKNQKPKTPLFKNSTYGRH